jgi:hypothetical protein
MESVEGVTFSRKNLEKAIDAAMLKINERKTVGKITLNFGPSAIFLHESTVDRMFRYRKRKITPCIQKLRGL